MQVKMMSLSEIYPDKQLNPRGLFEGIKGLAASLQQNGQENPLTVSAGVVPEGKDGAGRHILIGGYRRYAAMLELGWTEAMVQLSDAKPGLDMAIQAGRDNLERASMTTYETARYFLNLAETYKLTGKEIAERHVGALGVSNKYVLALTGLVGNKDGKDAITPEIKEQWAKRHPNATVNFLQELKGFDHKEQALKWAAACGTDAVKTKTGGKDLPPWDAEKACQIVATAKSDRAARVSSAAKTPEEKAAEEKAKAAKTAAKAAKARPDIALLDKVTMLARETKGIPDDIKNAVIATIAWCGGRTEDFLIAGVLVYSAEAEKEAKEASKVSAEIAKLKKAAEEKAAKDAAKIAELEAKLAGK